MSKIIFLQLDKSELNISIYKSAILLVLASLFSLLFHACSSVPTNAKDIDDEDEYPLHYLIRQSSFKTNPSADEKKLTRLLKEGIDVNAKDSLSITPLMVAVAVSNLEMVKILLNHGANTNTVLEVNDEIDTHSPLSIAVESYIYNKRYKNALGFRNLKQKTNGVQIARLLLEKGANPNHILLFKLKVSDRIFKGKDILCIAAKNSKIDSEIITLLAKHGADVDSKCFPLEVAIREGNAKVVVALLENGADPNRSYINKDRTINPLDMVQNYYDARNNSIVKGRSRDLVKYYRRELEDTNKTINSGGKRRFFHAKLDHTPWDRMSRKLKKDTKIMRDSLIKAGAKK